MQYNKESLRPVFLGLLESTSAFPIEFDAAWQWLGYSRKDKAKALLVKAAIENIDYQLHLSGELRPQGGFSNREDIKLTIDCFKSLAMMADTEQGKAVRQWYLEVEKEWRYLKQAQVQIDPADNIVKGINLVFDILQGSVSEEIIKSAKLTAIARKLPQLSTEAEEAKKILSATMPVEERLLSPTELGELVTPKLKPTEINNLLCQKGFQTKLYRERQSSKYAGVTRKELHYELTDAGKEFGQVLLNTARNNSKTVANIRWYPKVVKQLVEH